MNKFPNLKDTKNLKIYNPPKGFINQYLTLLTIIQSESMGISVNIEDATQKLTEYSKKISALDNEKVQMKLKDQDILIKARELYGEYRYLRKCFYAYAEESPRYQRLAKEFKLLERKSKSKKDIVNNNINYSI